MISKKEEEGNRKKRRTIWVVDMQALYKMARGDGGELEMSASSRSR